MKTNLCPQNWIPLSRYVEKEKIRGHIPSFKYFIDEEKSLSNYCSDKVFNHVKSKKILLTKKIRIFSSQG
jgi:hypothetical protein